MFLPLSFFLQKAAWGSLLFALHGSQGEGLTSGGWEDFIAVIRWHCIYSLLGRLVSFAHRTILRISGAYQIVFRWGSVALSVLDHLGHTPQPPRKVIFTAASSTGLHTEKQASESEHHAAFTQLAESVGQVLYCPSSVAFLYHVAWRTQYALSLLFQCLEKTTWASSFPNIGHPFASTANHSIPLFLLAWLLLFSL